MVQSASTSTSGGQRCAARAPREVGGTNDVTVSNRVNLVNPERFLHSTVLLRASCCVRYPEFGGCPLFRCCYCIKHMEISVGTYSSVRYLVEVRYWECPLIESPLYIQRTHNPF